MGALQGVDVDPLWMITDEENDSEHARVRPRHDLVLLTGIGMAVERAMDEQGIQLTSAKKWEIIGLRRPRPYPCKAGYVPNISSGFNWSEVR